MSAVDQSFSGHDFTAEFERLLSLLPEEYTDRNHSDAGISIVRLQASTSDYIYAFGDHVANEGFISWAQFKQSLIDLGLLVGYLPTLAAAASTRLRFARVDATGTDVITIPKYTAFGRADGLTYLTVDAVSIQSGSQSGEVDAIQGEVSEVDLAESDFAVMDFSGRPKYNLGALVAAGTVELAHGDPAVTWMEVDGFWRSQSDDFHFLCELNGADDSVWLALGDGRQGRKGTPSSEILHLRFVRTAGATGNGGHSTIYIVPEALDEFITCTNIEQCSGGAPAETLAEMRRQIPAVTRAQRRAVTTADYEALIGKLPGVLHVQALDRNDNVGLDGYLMPYEYILLYVVPEGGGALTTYLKELIWAECGLRGHLQKWHGRYILRDVTEVPVNVTIRIGVLSGYTVEAVAESVRAAISDILTPQNRTIGGTLTFTELHRAASSVVGVSWAEFDAPKADTRSNAGELLTEGVITVTAS